MLNKRYRHLKTDVSLTIVDLVHLVSTLNAIASVTMSTTTKVFKFLFYFLPTSNVLVSVALAQVP